MYAGEFLCHFYEVKNDYHYVTIVEDIQHGGYKWTNLTGREWSLKPNGITDQMSVGEECVYYKDGHHSVKYSPLGVHGPGHELYVRKCESSFIIWNLLFYRLFKF